MYGISTFLYHRGVGKIQQIRRCGGARFSSQNTITPLWSVVFIKCCFGYCRSKDPASRSHANLRFSYSLEIPDLLHL